MPPLITEWRYQNFDWYRYRDFFRRPNFPKPRLFSKTKFSETDTETLQKLAKISSSKWRLLNVLDIIWKELLQIFSSFFSSSKKRYSPSPNFFLLFLLLRNRTSTSTYQSFFRDQIFRNPNFFPRPNSPKPKLFSETKFSKTDTESLFSRPNVPKPRLLSLLSRKNPLSSFWRPPLLSLRIQARSDQLAG